jgi:hypothetical protein
MRLALSILLLLLATSACGKSETAGPAPAPTPTAGAATPTPMPTPTPTPESELIALREYAGKSPQEVKFLESEPLAKRLKALLGPKHKTLLANLQTVSLLKDEGGVLYLTGNKNNSGGADAAALVVDTTQDGIYVWLRTRGKAEEFKENGKNVTLPPDISTMIANAATAPKRKK